MGKWLATDDAYLILIGLFIVLLAIIVVRAMRRGGEEAVPPDSRESDFGFVPLFPDIILAAILVVSAPFAAWWLAVQGHPFVAVGSFVGIALSGTLLLLLIRWRSYGLAMLPILAIFGIWVLISPFL